MNPFLTHPLFIPGLIALGGGALLYFGRPNASQTLPPIPNPNAPVGPPVTDTMPQANPDAQSAQPSSHGAGHGTPPPTTSGWAWPVLARFPPGFGYGPGTGPDVYTLNPWY